MAQLTELPREVKRADSRIAATSLAGVVEGYASLFNVVDDGGDVVATGAFARSLRKRGAAGIKMLWQHQAAEPIGVWTSIVEDARGLKVEGRLDLSVARAREALSLIRSGAIDGLSIGFRARRATKDRTTGVRRLFDLDLWEISIVTFPMLTHARIDTVKRRAQGSEKTDALAARLTRLRAQRAALEFGARLSQLDDRRA